MNVHTHKLLALDHMDNIQLLVEVQLMSMHSYLHQEAHFPSNHMDYSAKKKKENSIEFSDHWTFIRIQFNIENKQCLLFFLFNPKEETKRKWIWCEKQRKKDFSSSMFWFFPFRRNMCFIILLVWWHRIIDRYVISFSFIVLKLITLVRAVCPCPCPCPWQCLCL